MHHWNYPEEEPEERYLGMTALEFNLAAFLIIGVIAATAFLYFGGTKVVDDLVDDGEPVSSVAQEATPTPEAAAAAAASPVPVASSVTQAPSLTPVEAAQAALLTIYDLPLGWTKAIEEDGGNDVLVPGYSGGGGSSWELCARDELAFSEELAAAESDDFEGSSGESLSSGVSVFPGDDAAAAAFATLEAAMERCQGELLETFEQAMAEEAAADVEGPTLSGMEIGIERPSLQTVGDSQIAYRVAGSVTVASDSGPIESVTVRFAADFVFVRSGALLEWLVYSSLGGVDETQEAALVGRAATKLVTADASLGG